MKKYDIEMDYGADIVNIYEYEELDDAQNLLERIEDGELDIIEDKCFISNVNELYVNGEEVKDWKEEFEEVVVPEKGLCATGGWCRGKSYFTLELPDEEKFEASKLIVSGFNAIDYRLDEDCIIHAEWEDDDDYAGQTGGEFYYNGVEIEE